MSHQTGIKGDYMLFIMSEAFLWRKLIETIRLYKRSLILNIIVNNIVRLICFFFFLANDALKKLFAKCRDGKIRVLKISIENGEFFC